MEYIDFLDKNIDFALKFWKKLPKDECSMATLNGNIELALEAGAGLILKVNAQAFKKENILTFFPQAIRRFGKVQEDGSRTFKIPGKVRAKLYAEKMGEPYLIFYAGSCGVAAHFAPSNIDSISVR